jgi:hypothetical protein
MEVQMDRTVSSQPLSDKRYLFRGKEVAHESCVCFSNRGHLRPLEHIGTPKGFGNKSSSIPSDLHQLIDEQLHRVGTAPRTCVSRTAPWQKDMIHTASAKYRVIHTHGNAGTQ